MKPSSSRHRARSSLATPPELVANEFTTGVQVLAPVLPHWKLTLSSMVKPAESVHGFEQVTVVMKLARSPSKLVGGGRWRLEMSRDGPVAWVPAAETTKNAPRNRTVRVM